MTRRAIAGFTLVEILIGLVLMGIVGLAITRLLTTSQRITQAQSQQVQLQSNIRTGAAMVPEELREINTLTASDIIAMTDTSIQYRAMRGMGVLCAVSASAVSVMADSFYYAYRTPQSGRDQLLVFVDNDVSISSDDVWRTAAVTGAVTTDNSCGRPTVVIPVTSLTTTGIVTGAPVRNSEIMSLELYQSGGENWLGARSVSGGETAPQPVLGPLKPHGFQLDYYTAAGAVTTSPMAVRDIQVTIRGLTPDAIHSGGMGSTVAQGQDSLVTRIRLRNVPNT